MQTKISRLSEAGGVEEADTQHVQEEGEDSTCQLPASRGEEETQGSNLTVI